MHAATGEGVAGCGDRTGQGLALARGHLDDVACQHPQRGLQLYIDGAQRCRALSCLAVYRDELGYVGGVGQVFELK